MFYYQRPKSSIWGHLLRKMPAGREKRLFDQFLTTAVAKHRFIHSCLWIHNSPSELVSRFERLLGLPSREGRFDALTLEQSAKCLDEIIKDEESGAGAAGRFGLSQGFDVSKWR